MSTISLITFLILSFSVPRYTEVILDKDILFYCQKGNFYSVTNIPSGQKYIGIRTSLGRLSLRLSNTNTKNLKLAIDGLEEVKKQVVENKFNPDDCVYYEKILDSSQYSDLFAFSFLCWRTSYQASNYGVSNYSYIPNSFYNKKKGMIINRLKNHNSIKAAQQIVYLENLSDIVRGGFMGNSVLDDLAFLSYDPNMDN